MHSVIVYKPDSVSRNKSGQQSFILQEVSLLLSLQPTRPYCDRQHTTLFGFAPREVYLAFCVTTKAVRSYRTISPLPTRKLAVSSLLHFLSPELCVRRLPVRKHDACRCPDFPHMPKHSAIARRLCFSKMNYLNETILTNRFLN